MKHKKLTALVLCFTMLFSITSGIFSAVFAADSTTGSAYHLDTTTGSGVWSSTTESAYKADNSIKLFSTKAAITSPSSMDYSGDIGKVAVFNEAFADDDYFWVLDVETPTLPWATPDTLSYYKTDFSKDILFEIMDVVVLSDTYMDYVDDTTDEMVEITELTLWYQVNIIAGTAEGFENGYWMQQNYLNEEDAYEQDLLILSDPLVVESIIGKTVAFKEATAILYDAINGNRTGVIGNTFGNMVVKAKFTDNNGIVWYYVDAVDWPKDCANFHYVEATDVVVVETEEATNPCAICGVVNCTTAHLYCEIHGIFDCGEEHDKQKPVEPDTTPVIPENPTLTEGADVSIVDEYGDTVTEEGFILAAGMRSSLSAWSDLEDEGNVSYQWQICYDTDLWADIQGQTGKGMLISPAMVQSIIDENDEKDEALIRCEVTSGDTVQYSANIPVTVKQNASPVMEQFRLARTANNAVPYAEIPELKQYTVVINYVFENNDTVAASYTATLAAGSNFTKTINHPIIMGYLPYVGNDTETSTKIELNIEDIQKDKTYTVTYKPTNVKYTVIHYQQNVDNDNYTIKETEQKSGQTKSRIPEVAINYTGFYALLYDKPVIAADGSTVVNVYYDRNYYLMMFNLGEGGYGVDPIYTRYGDALDIGTPTREGYTFAGWSLDGTTVVDLPETMPAEKRTYIALWDVDETAKVSVVIWGENADDENYSYIKTTEFYAKPGETITFASGNIACGYNEEHTHNDSCYDCENIEHTHSAECCTITAHTHGADCCTIAAHTHSTDCCSIAVHTHGTGCYASYNVDSNPTANPYGSEPDNPKDGQVHVGSQMMSGTRYYYVYINGAWYRFRNTSGVSNEQILTPGCNQEQTTHDDHTCVYNCGYTIEHEHNDGNCVYCNDPEHTHNGTDCIYCDLPEHTHTTKCLKCTEYEHTHSSSCYISDPDMNSKLWTYVRSDEVTVAANGSTVMNVYYDRKIFTLKFRADSSNVATITDKWGAKISDEFKKAPFNTTYNGRAWKCTETNKYGYALQTLDIMPQFDATFNLYNKSSNTLKTIYYYVENVGANVSHSIWPTSTNGFTLLKEVDTYFKYATYEEEYHEMEGFTRYNASVSGFGSDEEKDFINNEMYLYYLRNFYTLYFNNGYEVVENESVEYEDVLDQFNSYVPPAPASYEPGSVRFEGWYLNPKCTKEQKVDLNTFKMPNGNLVLYANWVPVNCTVEFYLDRNAYDEKTKLSTHPNVIVPHGSLVTPVPSNPTNGGYTFVGWFYEEDGVEKAFDFENMQVKKDLKVYGKWSSNVLKEYIVYFKIDDTNTQIADPIKGSTRAGETKTFDAKGGEELAPGYQEGYFPLVKSHSMTLEINTPATPGTDANGIEWVEITNADGTTKIVQSYTFWYVPETEVPYTVYYVAETLKESGTSLGTITRNGKTYYIIATTYTNSENRKAVVTEKFKQVPGYVPDAYQKRLVVDGSEGAVNEIIFYYSVDSAHAYYKITHYTQNTDGENWTEYATSQALGEIDHEYTAYPLTIDGFTYDSTVTKTLVGDKLIVGATSVSGTLTADGLELKLYYKRNSYPYEVRYLEAVTGKQLAEPKNKDASGNVLTGKYGQVISESAIDITNYTPDSTSKDLNIHIEESRNIITFYYEENEVTIKYEVVPDGSGSVDPTSETVKVVTGVAKGSTATASPNYRFVGWYSDAACEKQVSTNIGYVPTKEENEVWVDGTTYYAKFELDIADLTITKSGWNSIDENQSFIFTVTGPNGFTLDVVIHGNGSVTIKDLPIGEYTVTEKTDWSWRYTDTPDWTFVTDGNTDASGENNAVATITLGASGNKITFTNERSKSKIYWLDGGTWCDNLFDGTNTTDTPSGRTKNLSIAFADIVLREETTDDDELTVQLA